MKVYYFNLYKTLEIPLIKHQPYIDKAFYDV